jgi:fatty acid desaturase 2 (delta-6 desaturase)
MGKGGNSAVAGSSPLTWPEVSKHCKKDDRWIVVDGEVYDVSRWAKKHPGGSRLLGHYAGQDASEAFRAFHNDPVMVRKYMKPLHVGSLVPSEEKQKEIKEDFEQLRQTVTKMGLFKPSVTFFTLSIVELIALEVFAYWVILTYGNNWLPWTLALVALATLQAQGGWIQHDYGHLSVFKSSSWNHAFHIFTMNVMKGAGADWWNHMHYQHHAKPNVIDKDPDVRLEKLFVLGDTMAERAAKKWKKSLPYNLQHRYFFATLPPLLFPLYFQFMIFRHTITRRKWFELFTLMLFYVRFFAFFTTQMGLFGAMKFYFCVRVLESHWFVWVSQSNHIPMSIEDDKERPWLALQMYATCDIEKGHFNDWFTGHLNHQIEHHLFPTMPRHNLYKAVPLVRSLCEKHGIPYTTKTLLGAFGDIIRSLESSGQIWNAYYHAYHMS